MFGRQKFCSRAFSSHSCFRFQREQSIKLLLCQVDMNIASGRHKMSMFYYLLNSVLSENPLKKIPFSSSETLKESEEESDSSTHDFEHEVEVFSKKIESDPCKIEYRSGRCEALMNLGKFETAKIDAEKIIAIDPENSKGNYLGAKCNQALGDLPTALALLLKLPINYPCDVSEFNEVLAYKKMEDDINMKFDTKLYRECLDAIGILHKMTHIETDRLKLMKAKCHFHCEDFEKSREILLEVVMYDPKNIEAAFILANCYYHEGDLSQCIIVYEAILKWQNDSRVYEQNEKVKKLRDLMWIGNDFYVKKSYRKSVKKFTKALDLEQLNKKVAAANFNNRGMALKKSRYYRSAVDDFNESFKLNSSDKSIHGKRAYCLYKIGRYLECITDCDEALKLGGSEDFQFLKFKAERKLMKSSIWSSSISSRYKKFAQPSLGSDGISFSSSTETSSSSFMDANLKKGDCDTISSKTNKSVQNSHAK